MSLTMRGEMEAVVTDFIKGGKRDFDALVNKIDEFSREGDAAFLTNWFLSILQEALDGDVTVFQKLQEVTYERRLNIAVNETKENLSAYNTIAFFMGNIEKLDVEKRSKVLRTLTQVLKEIPVKMIIEILYSGRTADEASSQVEETLNKDILNMPFAKNLIKKLVKLIESICETYSEVLQNKIMDISFVEVVIETALKEVDLPGLVTEFLESKKSS